MPAPFDVDGAAFEHQPPRTIRRPLSRRLPLGQAQQFSHAAGKLIVEMPVGVLGPGVEPPVGEATRPSALRTKIGPESRVHPRSVGQQVKAHPVEFAPARSRMPLRAPFGLRVLDQNVHALPRREQAHDLRIKPGNGLELARPVLGIVRPGQPGGLVRLPLGGHAVAQGVSLRSFVFAWCKQSSTWPVALLWNLRPPATCSRDREIAA